MTLSVLLLLGLVFSVGLCVGMVVMELWSCWLHRECQPSDTSNSIRAFYVSSCDK
jgi:hypothetical protein